MINSLKQREPAQWLQLDIDPHINVSPAQYHKKLLTKGLTGKERAFKPGFGSETQKTNL